MFGFPGSPSTPQNLGVLDMRAAINWVSQNIANFGGDPSRIVVFSQSAGAVAADMLIYAFPQTDTPIKGLILQSGTAAVFAGLGQMNTTGRRGAVVPRGDADGVRTWETTKRC